MTESTGPTGHDTELVLLREALCRTTADGFYIYAANTDGYGSYSAIAKDGNGFKTRRLSPTAGGLVEVLVERPAGATGHDTPAPTAEFAAAIEAAGLLRSEYPDQMAAASCTCEPEAVCGAHRLLARYAEQNAKLREVMAERSDMRRQRDEALSGRTATPDDECPRCGGSGWQGDDSDVDEPCTLCRVRLDLPPGVEPDGDGWKLRQGSQYPIDPRWEIDYPGFGWRPLTEMEARGRVAGADRQVRPVASITEEPTGGSLASSIAAAKEAAEALAQHPDDPACPACRRPLSEHRPGIYDCPSITEEPIDLDQRCEHGYHPPLACPTGECRDPAPRAITEEPTEDGA